MRNPLWICALLCLLFASSARAGQQPVVLARDAVPQVPILLPAVPTPAEQTAAAELKHYLDGVTGGSFVILSESEAPACLAAIYVGRTAPARARGLVFAEPERWAIDVADGSVILAGGQPRGTLYGTWQFLEELGVRWWTFREEHVPNRPAVQVAPGRRGSEPAFAFRHVHAVIWQGEPIWKDYDGRFPARLRLSRWGGRDIDPKYGYDAGLAAFPLPWVAHTLTGRWVPPNLINNHPDWFALRGGKRVAGSLCLSNPALRNHLEAKLREAITAEIESSRKENRARKLIYNFSNSDVHATQCYCPACQAESGNTPGNAAVTLQAVNDLADRIAADYPAVRLEMLAYNDTEPPPPFRARPNVIVTLADTVSSRSLPPDHPLNVAWAGKLAAWRAVSDTLRLWLYGWNYDFLAEPPVPVEFALPRKYRFFKTLRLDGMMVQYDAHSSWKMDLWDMKVYLHAKLMENPQADFHALLADWLDGYFGPGGKYVLQYRQMLHDAMQANPPWMTLLCKTDLVDYRYLTAELLARANHLLDQAELACEGQPVFLRRLGDVRRTVDLTTVFAWPMLMRKWLDAGKAWEDFPLDRQRAAERALAAIREHVAFRFDQATADAAIRAIQPRIDFSLAQNDHWPSPTELDGQPVTVLLEQVPSMAGSYGTNPIRVADPESQTGVTEQAQLTPDGETRLAGGIWHVPEFHDIAVTKARPVFKQDIPGPGYHWYRIFDGVKIRPGDRLYLTDSWVMQYSIAPVYDPSEPEKRYDLWVHAKFTEPEPSSESRPAKPQPITISIDRVLVTTHD